MVLSDISPKVLFSFVITAAAIAFVGIFFFAYYLEERNVEPDDMRLPMTAGVGKPVVSGTDLTSRLSQQNMTEKEVAMMLSDIIAECFSFNRTDYMPNVAAMNGYFTQAGFAQYRQFLQETNIQAQLAEKDLQAGAFAEQAPLLLTEGVYDNVYKWLFEVPVTISLTPRNASAYGRAMDSVNTRRILLRAQFARVNDPDDPDAIKIEIWQVMPPRAR